MRRWVTTHHEPAEEQDAAVGDLRALAGRQAGRVSTAQAQRAGCSARTLLRLARSGEVDGVRKGLIRFVAAGDGPGARDWETVLAAGAVPYFDEHEAVGAALSHATALARQGVTRAAEFAACDVLVVGKAKPAVPWATVHRTARLESLDLRWLDGLPVTTAARALVDLAAALDWADLVALVDDTLCASLTSRTWLHRRALRLRPGRPRAQRILDVTHPDAAGEFWSWLERRFGEVLAGTGLPAPQWNHEVRDERGRIGWVDAYWARPGFDRDLVVELEGLRFHSQPAQRRADAQRFNRLSRRHATLRFTWEDVVRTPEQVVATLRDRLALP